jgi:CRISPR-associated protein Cas1
LEVLNKQLKVKKPLNSQLWGRIVLAKLSNQRKLLEIKNRNQYYIEQISGYIDELKSNDKTNREALAARAFFSGLYGEYFSRKRKSEDEINIALNYGYTILAMALCRYLCMYGFNTIIGIHHESKSNNFNLAYDFVEPFRPIVDGFVYDNLDNLNFPITTDIKMGLIKLLTKRIRLNNKNYLVEHAMEEMILSYIKALDSNDSSMLYVPEIVDDV